MEIHILQIMEESKKMEIHILQIMEERKKMGIYQELYNLIQTYIYGNVALTSDMSLVCTLISTIGSLFIVALPFLIVYKVIAFIGRF